MWEELKSVFLYWIEPGRHDLSRRQSAHQGVSLLGVGHCGDQARSPGGVFPCRGLHAPQDHVPAGEARLRPVLHLFPLAQWQAGDHGLSDRADTNAGARIFPAQPMAEHARHSHRVFADGRRACLRDPLAAGGDAWAPTTASMARRSNCSRIARCATAAKNISTRRNTRFATGIWIGPTACGRSSRASTGFATRIPRCKMTGRSRFHFCENDQMICYTKESDDRSNLLLTVVNLDPHHTQSGFVTLPLDELEIPEDRAYEAEDLLSGERYLWHGPRNYVELNPDRRSGHILQNPPPAESGDGLRVLPLKAADFSVFRLIAAQFPGCPEPALH